MMPLRMECESGARHDASVRRDDIGVVRRAFRHQAVLDQPGIVGAAPLRLHLGHRGIEKLDRLDVPPLPAQVGERHDPDAAFGKRVGEQVFRLREDDERRRDVVAGIGKIAVRHAARDLQIDQAFIEPVRSDHFADGAQQVVVGERRAHFEFAERPFQPPHMPVIVDQPAAQDGDDLVDAIGKKKAAIEDRNLRRRIPARSRR